MYRKPDSCNTGKNNMGTILHPGQRAANAGTKAPNTNALTRKYPILRTVKRKKSFSIRKS